MNAIGERARILLLCLCAMLEEGDVEPLAGGSGMPQKSVKAQEMHTMFTNRFCCDVCGMVSDDIIESV